LNPVKKLSIDIRSMGFWRVMIVILTDRLLGVKVANVLHLPTSIADVIILYICHCFEIKIYERVPFKKLIVTQIVNKLPMSFGN
jgi:hypothetical protein